ncbi:MAG TPA: AI-2E family transporter [Candidatus Limnocylindrales bacterium]|nr:AI-2E family transporter [Candidatus Limnocylindrales bacterium]
MIQRRRVEELWENRDLRAWVFVGVLAILVLILAIAIRGIIGPFILATVLALLLNPLVNVAERRRVPRAVSVLGLYALAILLLGAGVYFLVPMARAEFTALVAQGPAIAAYLQDLAARRHVVSILGVPVDLQQAYANAVANLPAVLAGHLQSVVQNVFVLFNWLFQTVLVLLIAFFLVKDAHAIRRFLADLVPFGFRSDSREIGQEISRMLGAYMRGQLLICSLVGVTTGIALWIAGIPYALALGIVAGVTAFIPFIGPFLGALPAVAVAAFVSQSTGKVILVIALFVVISNVIYNVISPKVFGDAVHLSPMLVIVAFVIGGYLGGIIGLFIAVPVAAIIRILFVYAHERVYA